MTRARSENWSRTKFRLPGNVNRVVKAARTINTIGWNASLMYKRVAAPLLDEDFEQFSAEVITIGNTDRLSFVEKL